MYLLRMPHGVLVPPATFASVPMQVVSAGLTCADGEVGLRAGASLVPVIVAVLTTLAV